MAWDGPSWCRREGAPPASSLEGLWWDESTVGEGWGGEGCSCGISTSIADIEQLGHHARPRPASAARHTLERWRRKAYAGGGGRCRAVHRDGCNLQCLGTGARGWADVDAPCCVLCAL